MHFDKTNVGVTSMNVFQSRVSTVYSVTLYVPGSMTKCPFAAIIAHNNYYCPPTQGVRWQFTIISLNFLSICNSTKLLGSSNGTFFTPNWPLNYPSDATCSWTFYPPEGKTVRLFFTSFKMEEANECEPNRPSITADEIRINGG